MLILLTVAIGGSAAGQRLIQDNLQTCLAGKYPALCDHGALTAERKQIGVAAVDKFCARTCGVAAVAVARGIHNVANQSHQCPVFALNVEGNRGDIEPTLNPGFVSLVILTRINPFRICHRSRENNGSECRDNSSGFQEPGLCYGPPQTFIK